MKNNEYKKRLIDKKIVTFLEVFGAISIEGPKWCGKTWSSLLHAKSVTYMTEKTNKDNALISPNYILNGDRPQLVDEWQIVPTIWDSVRHLCDSDSKKGKFILTGSTSVTNQTNADVFHSGTGRIVHLKMNTMTLFESGDSTGYVSITDLLNNKIYEGFNKKIEIDELAFYLIRGGWPSNLNVPKSKVDIIPKSYIDSLIYKDMFCNSDKKRSSNKMKLVLNSLSRNIASTVSLNTLVSDINLLENEHDLIETRITLNDYLSVLEDLYIIDNQEAFSTNYRSSSRIGKTSKRHLTDPSLACACLDLSVEKLLNDHKTFGLLFESLVYHDLKIYTEYLDGHVYHFRDNALGHEIDSILEFRDGSYGAIEVKLTRDGINSAIKSLVKFYSNVDEKPKFMCVVVGFLDICYKDEATGIFIVPLTSLKP